MRYIFVVKDLFRGTRFNLMIVTKSAEVVRSLKSGNVWVFVQLICRERKTKNQLFKTQTLPNLRLFTTSAKV